MTSTKSNKKNKLTNKKENFFSIITGAVSGFINGIFGGGGGMIVVPMLIGLLKRSQKKAHATAILIILPLSILSGIFYAVFGKFDLKIGLPTGSGVIVGGLAGALLLSKIKSKIVNIIFILAMLAAGVKMMLF